MKRNGFTLVELLVVIVIIAALLGLFVPLVKNLAGGEEAEYQPTIEELQLQEAQRANDLKERELNERAAERQNVE